MNLIPLKSTVIKSGDDLIEAFQNSLTANGQQLHDGDIVVVASKVVAYSQGLLRPAPDQTSFRQLIREQADKVLEEGDMVLTLKNRVLIPNAGIDNSNTPEGQVVLWPNDPFGTARQLLHKLELELELHKLGIVISDSHCQPLRMGTSGIAIGWAGFEGVRDERGSDDLFGKKMQYTKIAVADNLASAANLLMGETDASIPFVIVRNLAVRWSEAEFTEADYFIKPGECIYRGLYNEKLVD